MGGTWESLCIIGLCVSAFAPLLDAAAQSGAASRKGILQFLWDLKPQLLRAEDPSSAVLGRRAAAVTWTVELCVSSVCTVRLDECLACSGNCLCVPTPPVFSARSENE